MQAKGQRQKVVVAMSGGVDSSVCAAILKDKGFDVFGVTMQLKDLNDGPGRFGVGRPEDAKKIADKLQIEHHVFDLRQIFEEKVISYFCREYQQGRTPNPCVRCNKYIKFDILFQKAKELGADFIATGHYARIDVDEQSKRYLLKQGSDPLKEQSYFLYALSQEQLGHTLLPLGGLTKEEVKKIAREKGLPVAGWESQEICFIPEDDYGSFLKNRLPQGAKPGNIVDQEGQAIGEHQGIIFYTIGQRKGISIADKEALYVTQIDSKANMIKVGYKDDVYSNEALVDEVNLIALGNIEKPIKAEVKIRYMHPGARSEIFPQGERRVKIVFEQPQWALTPGQSAVFYDRETVIGGGIIKSSTKIS
ncbi:MAG: tRNA 2-thiouridine(34) synthase MnmA [Candidatus Omnitrophica bacterium]|nr:tRNA 2-thiouridine(34) synthase MnmA [Candidatus Omnitrophota bacterium]